MLMLRNKNGELVLVQHDEQLGRMPETHAERESIYAQIKEEVERAMRGHEQIGPCSERPTHPSFRGRPRK